MDDPLLLFELAASPAGRMVTGNPVQVNRSGESDLSD
jgi:hypothetical protein